MLQLICGICLGPFPTLHVGYAATAQKDFAVVNRAGFAGGSNS
jgi:hypothetical protein